MTTKEAWDKAHPAPARVRYFKDGKKSTQYIEADTKWTHTLSGGKVLVKLNGIPGLVPLDHVEPIVQPVAAEAAGGYWPVPVPAGTPYPPSSPWSGFDDLAADAEYRALVVEEMDQHRKANLQICREKGLLPDEKFDGSG